MNLDRVIKIQARDAINHSVKFDNLKKFATFIQGEVDFWANVKEKYSNKKYRLLKIVDIFISIQTSIDSWHNLDIWDDASLQQNVNGVMANLLNQSPNYWLWSQHGFTQKFVDILLERGEETADSFLSYQMNTNLQNPTSKKYFDGFLLGYEYENQNSDLVKRRHTERIQITKLRDQLLAKNDEAIALMSSNQHSYNEWFDDSKHKTSEWRQSVADDSERRHKAIKKVSMRNQKQLKSAFDSQMDSWKKRVDDLETLYEEKLRLKKPAQYWKVAAKKYASQGIIFIVSTLSIVAIAAMMVLHLFELWLIGSDSMLSVKTVQGATLFAAMAALFAFAIRATTRLAFSSFHLMRDAEEREQLTYLYLSLINESAVEKDSRDIVLQALFSRSETGLLANENGPTMPSLNDSIRTLSKSS